MTEAPAATEAGAEILTDGGLLAVTETSITAVLLRLPSLTSTCSDTALASARLGAVNETESASVEDNSTAKALEAKPWYFDGSTETIELFALDSTGPDGTVRDGQIDTA